MIYHVLSKTGGRTVNEDYAGVTENKSGFCAILADGLGGHGRGEVASELVVDNGLSMWNSFYGSTEEFLNGCFQNGQARLLAKQEEEHAQGEMKTTMTALVSDGNKVQWGHIGDSRLYCFYKGHLTARTLDHSVPQMLVASGEIKEKDIRGHEDRNRLLRVMGAPWDKPKYELSKPVDWDDSLVFLLCSDGFWELIEEKEMTACLKKAAGPEEWLKEMEAVVLKNGKGKNMDNYTAIGIFLGEEKEHSGGNGLFSRLFKRR
ncbi:protein phosphatase 2C domain-containing protein [Clostridium sp. AM58-1XD]|uniref:PP2C family protein-serine/threonine phosphatase n=1 Tax=Clostridium sp. AM58-1XD TaxID=2292307 RepID=UPI000E4B2744|nr:protein phosphatase 2C domain-containing protein [Clostridium sp. AM58-1XD]RGZ01889.1 serine/threonine-protein phosphatase [Clostridium sp. AM58-1XD]